MKQKYRHLIFLIIGVTIISSCFKDYYYKFSEEEASFLPYNLGDSLELIQLSDTVIMYVNEFEKWEIERGFGRRYIHDTWYANFTDTAGDFSINWNQSKRDNVFKCRISMKFTNVINEFLYSHDPSESIIRHESFIIKNEKYTDVIHLIDSSSNSNLYINSSFGFLLLEADSIDFCFY